jgi:hypothetical protein
VHRRMWLAGTAVFALVIAGCAGDDEPSTPIGGDEAAQGADEVEDVPDDSGDEPEESDEPEDVDVTVVPDEITEDYVEAVLAELEQIRRDALVEYRESGDELTIEVADMTASVFTSEEVEHERADFDRIADADYDGVRPVDEMEPVRAEVIDLLSANDECLLVETLVSFDGLLEAAPEPRERIYHLVTQDRELVEDYNPTPWVIAATPSDVERWRQEDPC